MPSPGFRSSQEEEEGRKVNQSAGDVELTKRRRISVRSQITSTIRQIRTNIDQCGSRGGITGLVKHLQDLATTSTLLHTFLLTVEDASEKDRQEERHRSYVQQVGEAVAEAEEHLKSRAGEAPSGVNDSIKQDSKRAVRASEEEIRGAQQTRTQAEQSRRKAEVALQKLQTVDSDLDKLSSVSNGGQFQPFSRLAAEPTPPIQKASVCFAARVNQVSSKHSSISHISWKSASHPFCFKCEGEQSLESHGAFKSSSAGERVSFRVKHRLCFGNPKPSQSIRVCHLRKPCSQSGRALFCHALLPDVKRVNSHASIVIYPATLLIDNKGHQRVEMGSNSTLMQQGFPSLLKLCDDHLILSSSSPILNVIRVRNVIDYPLQRSSFSMGGSVHPTTSIVCSTLPTVTTDTSITDWPVPKERWKDHPNLSVSTTCGMVDILIGNGLLPRVTAVRANTIIRSTRLVQPADAMNQSRETDNFDTEYQVTGMSEDHRKTVSILDGGTRKFSAEDCVKRMLSDVNLHLQDWIPNSSEFIQSVVRGPHITCIF
ncbi:uncharacterized protein LOC124327882 [Daphnia pulicaria]|jgi:hypothetical protein|uniref:uncharacterized protein LOC124327882 n=1 Tax=Daphnia pulicaria TaxID=35523 RepID=UPI001EEC9F1E|nr:uncharacterized protein LOC124327882 [Daphnia pulicaria]